MSDYYKVAISLQPFNQDAADFLSALLADIGFESFEESEDGLNAYIVKDVFDSSALNEAFAQLPFPLELSHQIELIQHTDWNEVWEKNYFKPLVLAGGRCVVRSSFHTDFPEAEFEILIDPKMAFGTGHHATTSMMVDHLFGLDLKDKSVLDMGTGTGILAILAAKLDAREVTGIEIDPSACENAVENAGLNKAHVNFITGDASLLKDIKGIDIFLANINRNIILADLDRYVSTLSDSGVILLSGFYSADIPLLETALNECGMKIAETYTKDGDWASIKAEKFIK